MPFLRIGFYAYRRGVFWEAQGIATQAGLAISRVLSAFDKYGNATAIAPFDMN